MAGDLMLNKRNVVVATHNVTTPKGARLEHLARLNMFFLLRRFRNFHTFSFNQKKSLESKVTGKKVLLAPLALKDYGPLPSDIKESKINFLSFGHVRNYKRIDLLILAAQKAYEETGILFKVTIAGSCNEWPKYQQFIQYPELFDLRIGFINDDEIPLLIAKCNYLVLPYQDLAQSGAITVAFNYNIPVICSDIPQFKEVVSDGVNGYLFKSESVEDLKMVFMKCLNLSLTDYQYICKSTKQYVFENYAIESIGKRYIEFFGKLNCIV
jgi:glycosyltransferase involved in cell wall biosynthesis